MDTETKEDGMVEEGNAPVEATNGTAKAEEIKLVPAPIEHLEAMISNDSRGFGQMINAHLMAILEMADNKEEIPEQMKSKLYSLISSMSTSSYELGKLQTIQHLSGLYPEAVGKDYKMMDCAPEQAVQAAKVWEQHRDAVKTQSQ